MAADLEFRKGRPQESGNLFDVSNAEICVL
jgi:hypothetical protein